MTEQIEHLRGIIAELKEAEENVKTIPAHLTELRAKGTTHALASIAESLHKLTGEAVEEGEHAAHEVEAKVDSALGAPGDPDRDVAEADAADGIVAADQEPEGTGTPADAPEADTTATPPAPKASGRRAASGPAPEVLKNVSGTANGTASS